MNRPNIVILITDQQRADLTAREGYPLDVTPFVDSLAASGAWFDRAYTTAPVCSPARTSLLTGRYPSAHRVTQNAVTGPVTDGHLFSVARAAGYATSLIGKNHTFLTESDVDLFTEFSHGGQRSGARTEREEEFDGWLNGLSHRTSLVAAPGGVTVQNPYRIVSHAIEWVDSLPADNTPFITQISFPEPHNPYQAPEPYFDMFPPEVIPPPLVGAEFLATAAYPWQHLRAIAAAGEPGHVENMGRARSNYLGMLRFIDDQIARFVAYLDSRGLAENTLFLVTSDHGDYFGEYGLMRKGAGISDVLMRIPFVAHGRGVAIQPDARGTAVSLADVLPTLCDYMGTPSPAGVQGRSLRPVLEDTGVRGATSAYGEQGIGGARFLSTDLAPGELPGLPGRGSPVGAPCFDELNAVTQAGRMRMVRQGDWKLVVDDVGGHYLYDLVTDPSEVHDLSADPACSEVVRELLAVMTQWLIHVEDELPLPEGGYRRKQATLPGG